MIVFNSKQIAGIKIQEYLTPNRLRESKYKSILFQTICGN